MKQLKSGKENRFIVKVLISRLQEANLTFNFKFNYSWLGDTRGDFNINYE